MLRTSWIIIALIGGFIWRWLMRPQPVSTRDKVVIITGASSGIGAATAHSFAKGGAKVVLAARRAEKLEALAADLAQYNVETLVVPTDVSQDADLETLVSQTLAKFGRIDVLINNAGIAVGGSFADDITPEHIQKLTDINFYGTIRLTQLVLPTMLKQKSGHIINISSMSSMLRAPGWNVYAATKSGLNTFTDGLRREVASKGIRVSKVLPGWVYTPMIGGETRTPEQVRAALEAGGVFMPGMTLDTAETLAEVIIDVYRTNKRSAMTGGSMVGLGLLTNATPDITDHVMRLMNTQKMMDTYREWT